MSQRLCLAVGLALLAAVVLVQGRNENNFPDLTQSQMLRADALLRWLIHNRTENGTLTFLAGFMRLCFHDCFSGCDGCLNLNNPANAGLRFYKQPLDMMYADYMTEVMSRADWYALAGRAAVRYAAELSDCEGEGCVPDMPFQFGRIDCQDEMLEFRNFPPPMEDPRTKIRLDFNMTLQEITALMGAHTLGRHHSEGKNWVTNNTQLDNQYYKDMLSPRLRWTWEGQVELRGWVHGRTKQNVMLQSDMFMAYNVSNPKMCSPNPILKCNQSYTYALVHKFASDNKYWLQEYGKAFSRMLANTKPHVGILKDVIRDTDDNVFTGDINEVLAFQDLPEEDWSDFTLPPPVMPINAELAELRPTPQPTKPPKKSNSRTTQPAASGSTTARATTEAESQGGARRAPAPRNRLSGRLSMLG